MPRPVLCLALLLCLPACDSSPSPAAAKAEEKKSDDAELKARLEKRAADRKAKEEADKKAEEDRVARVKEVTTIPEGAKMPKKMAQACEEVGAAQTAFMKKFHSEVPEDAVFTQVGLIKKQCNGLEKIEVAMCWKFALDATTDELKEAINDYLKVCLEKYGGGAPK
jgi:hypothetical protein